MKYFVFLFFYTSQCFCSEFNIRKANLQDVDIIQLLLESAHIPQDKNFVFNKINKYLESEKFFIYVVEKDTIVVGCIAGIMYTSFLHENNRCNIEFLAIHPEYKRQGIGKLLLGFIEELAIVNQCVLIDLISAYWRQKEGVFDFYYSLGFKNEGEWARAYLRKDLVL